MYGLLIHNSATDMDAVKAALECGVGVCPGSIFAGDNKKSLGFIRIHCGVTEEKARDIASRLLANAKVQ